MRSCGFTTLLTKSKEKSEQNLKKKETKIEKTKKNKFGTKTDGTDTHLLENQESMKFTGTA